MTHSIDDVKIGDVVRLDPTAGDSRDEAPFWEQYDYKDMTASRREFLVHRFEDNKAAHLGRLIVLREMNGRIWYPSCTGISLRWVTPLKFLNSVRKAIEGKI